MPRKIMQVLLNEGFFFNNYNDRLVKNINLYEEMLCLNTCEQYSIYFNKEMQYLAERS